MDDMTPITKGLMEAKEAAEKVLADASAALERRTAAKRLDMGTGPAKNDGGAGAPAPLVSAPRAPAPLASAPALDVDEAKAPDGAANDAIAANPAPGGFDDGETALPPQQIGMDLDEDQATAAELLLRQPPPRVAVEVNTFLDQVKASDLGPKVVLLDLETSGKETGVDCIIQVALLHPMSGNRCVIYVKPEVDISDAALEVHQMDDNQLTLRGAVPVVEAMGKMLEFLSDKKTNLIFVGHNVIRFDVPIIVRTLRELGLSTSVFLDAKYIDTYDMAETQLNFGSQGNDLSLRLCDIFGAFTGVAAVNAHDADYDNSMTLVVLSCFTVLRHGWSFDTIAHAAAEADAVPGLVTVSDGDDDDDEDETPLKLVDMDRVLVLFQDVDGRLPYIYRSMGEDYGGAKLLVCRAEGQDYDTVIEVDGDEDLMLDPRFKRLPTVQQPKSLYRGLRKDGDGTWLYAEKQSDLATALDCSPHRIKEFFYKSKSARATDERFDVESVKPFDKGFQLQSLNAAHREEAWHARRDGERLTRAGYSTLSRDRKAICAALQRLWIDERFYALFGRIPSHAEGTAWFSSVYTNPQCEHNGGDLDCVLCTKCKICVCLRGGRIFEHWQAVEASVHQIPGGFKYLASRGETCAAAPPAPDAAPPAGAALNAVRAGGASATPAVAAPSSPPPKFLVAYHRPLDTCGKCNTAMVEFGDRSGLSATPGSKARAEAARAKAKAISRLARV